jgi:hypothetical protein
MDINSPDLQPSCSPVKSSAAMFPNGPSIANLSGNRENRKLENRDMNLSVRDPVVSIDRSANLA